MKTKERLILPGVRGEVWGWKRLQKRRYGWERQFLWPKLVLLFGFGAELINKLTHDIRTLPKLIIGFNLKTHTVL